MASSSASSRFVSHRPLATAIPACQAGEIASVTRRPLTILILAAAAGVLGFVACSADDERAPSTPSAGGGPTTSETTDDGDDGAGTVDGTSQDPTTDETSDATDPETAVVTPVATGFAVPWGLVPLDDGSLLVGERDTADVFRVVPGSEPVLVTTVPGVAPGGEGGLLGLAVDADSPWHAGVPDVFYAYATTADDNQVLRVQPRPDGGEASVEVVLDGIPKAGNHNGGRIAFGPDDYLYVTTGDASEGASAQDPESLAGKILRITVDGEPAPDNPDPSSPVLSLGHRNVQGLDWDEAGRLWASEFGQNALDEVNLIQPGENYGWPEVEGPGGEPECTDPVVSWPTEDASPSGLAVGPDGSLYVAALRGESLWRVPVQDRGTGTDRNSVTVGEPERLLEGEFGRLRSVVSGQGRQLWLLTNNTFRGEPGPEDDRLLLIADPAALE